MALLGRILAALQGVRIAWWSRIAAAKGGQKAMWGAAPLVGVCLLCAMAQAVITRPAGQQMGTSAPAVPGANPTGTSAANTLRVTATSLRVTRVPAAATATTATSTVAPTPSPTTR